MNSVLILIVILVSAMGIIIACLPREFWDKLWENLKSFPTLSAAIFLTANAALSWCLHGILNNEVSSVLPATIAAISAILLVFYYDETDSWLFCLGIILGFSGAKTIDLGLEYYNNWRFWGFFIALCIAIVSSLHSIEILEDSNNYNKLQQCLVTIGVSWIGLMLGLLFSN